MKNAFSQYSVFEILDFLKSYEKLGKIVDSINVKDILSSPHAQEYDRITVREWFEKHADSRFLVDVGEVMTKNLFGVPASKISFLYFAVYIRSGGSLDNILDNTDAGADASKVGGGTQQFSLKLASIVGWDKIYLKHILLRLKLLNENKDDTLVEAIVQNAVDETKVFEKLHSHK